MGRGSEEKRVIAAGRPWPDDAADSLPASLSTFARVAAAEVARARGLLSGPCPPSCPTRPPASCCPGYCTKDPRSSEPSARDPARMGRFAAFGVPGCQVEPTRDTRVPQGNPVGLARDCLWNLGIASPGHTQRPRVRATALDHFQPPRRTLLSTPRAFSSPGLVRTWLNLACPWFPQFAFSGGGLWR